MSLKIIDLETTKKILNIELPVLYERIAAGQYPSLTKRNNKSYYSVHDLDTILNNQTKQIATFMNIKGGVGKTTLSTNMAAGLALSGKKVLFLDFDPQANGTVIVSGKDNFEKSFYNYLTGEKGLSDLICDTQIDNLKFIPSNMILFNFNTAKYDLATLGKFEDDLDEIKNDFDVIIVDTPPSTFGLLAVLGVIVSTNIYICVEPGSLSLENMGIIFKEIAALKRILNQEPIVKVLLNKLDNRTKISSESNKLLQSTFNDRMADSTIRINTKFIEASANYQSIFEHHLKSAEDIIKLIIEFRWGV
ncbi:AAA family ATPase [uncultured Desulfobacter sp.]|uniref:ParA family protein n=1 Tax=uncultured Desulfobacter sp. TaxID=240139 RepID=UPI0029F50EA0|nr:AAA family ATPase [uncultured Desulfobacter sp.]